ncbi:MAG: helix-turn-helix domain-containing protein, partial [Gemmatimonadota bacterium]
IPMLAQHFADRLVRDEGLPVRRLSDAALQRLWELDWPGNVRELRNTVERLLILSSGAEVTEADVLSLVGVASEGGEVEESLLAIPTFTEFREAAERTFLSHKLREHDWNVSETARSLEMPRSNLYKKIERHGLEREE